VKQEEADALTEGDSVKWETGDERAAFILHRIAVRRISLPHGVSLHDGGRSTTG
jgi:hypothetical protein